MKDFDPKQIFDHIIDDKSFDFISPQVLFNFFQDNHQYSNTVTLDHIKHLINLFG